MPFFEAIARMILIVLALTICACSGLLFYPYSQHLRNPRTLGLDYRDVVVQTGDNVKIHGWFLPAIGTLKGSVYFLHGNAENISTHIESVKWLPRQGYQVFLIDYRGFGLSEGRPFLPEVFLDIKAGFGWLIEHSRNKPVFLLGQSIGASLGVYFAATNPQAKRYLAGIISDSGFTDYFQIARHAASSFWLTWPFQYPIAWLMDYPYNAIDVIADLAPIPLLICHGKRDEIVPLEHAEQLYHAAKQPKLLLITEDGHIQTFINEKNRAFVLNFINRIGAARRFP